MEEHPQHLYAYSKPIPRECITAQGQVTQGGTRSPVVGAVDRASMVKGVSYNKDHKGLR